MNANDHAEHDDNETALKKLRLKKVEEAIEITKRSLEDLEHVREALRSELGMYPRCSLCNAESSPAAGGHLRLVDNKWQCVDAAACEKARGA